MHARRLLAIVLVSLLSLPACDSDDTAPADDGGAGAGGNTPAGGGGAGASGAGGAGGSSVGGVGGSSVGGVGGSGIGGAGGSSIGGTGGSNVAGAAGGGGIATGGTGGDAGPGGSGGGGGAAGSGPAVCKPLSATPPIVKALDGSVSPPRAGSIGLDKLDGSAWRYGTFNGTVNFHGTSATASSGADLFFVGYDPLFDASSVTTFGGVVWDLSFGMVTTSTGGAIFFGYGTFNFPGGGTQVQNTHLLRVGAGGSQVWTKNSIPVQDTGEPTAIAIDSLDDVFIAAKRTQAQGTINLGGPCIYSSPTGAFHP
jgi:hypothetical protein